MAISDDAIPWWEDDTLKRKLATGTGSLAFIIKSSVELINTGATSVEGWVDAMFGVGVLWDAIFGLIARLKSGRNPKDPAPEIIPAVTPNGVEKVRNDP